MTTMHNPASPGELLREFIGERSITEVAEHIGVARATLSRLLNGRTSVTVDLSIRLGEALSLSPDFFSKAQLQYDLWEASRQKRRKVPSLAEVISVARPLMGGFATISASSSPTAAGSYFKSRRSARVGVKVTSSHQKRANRQQRPSNPHLTPLPSRTNATR